MKTIVLHIINPYFNDIPTSKFFDIASEKMNLEVFKKYLSQNHYNKISTLSHLSIDVFGFCNNDSLSLDNCFQIKSKNKKESLEFCKLILNIYKEKNLLKKDSSFNISRFHNGKKIRDYTSQFDS